MANLGALVNDLISFVEAETGMTLSRFLPDPQRPEVGATFLYEGTRRFAQHDERTSPVSTDTTRLVMVWARPLGLTESTEAVRVEVADLAIRLTDSIRAWSLETADVQPLPASEYSLRLDPLPTHESRGQKAWLLEVLTRVELTYLQERSDGT